jgi:hypothetical protein
VVKLVIVVLVACLGTAHADSPKLAEARTAVDQVRYDDAQRLLVEALAAGGNSVAAVREIYQLAASTAVVLGQRELGEQYYRRWLALDPAAKLPDGSSPKLVDAFVAAQAYMAAHGRLMANAQLRGSQVDVIVEADPLHMAVSVSAGGPPVALVDRRARVTATNRVAILDDRGNQLVVLDVIAEPTSPVVPAPIVRPPSGTPPPRRSRGWIVWAVPSAALVIAGGVFGALAIKQERELDDVITASGEHFFSEVEGKSGTIERNATIGIALGGAGLLLAIPATVFYVRGQRASFGRVSLQPVVHAQGLGVAGVF